MTQRSIMSLGALAIAMGLLWPDAAAGQNSGTAQPAATLAKTPDGQPDISGLWLYFDQTPLETPGTPPRRRLGEERGQEGASDAAQQAAQQRRSAERGGQAEVNPFYAEAPMRARVKRRPSLVIDPPDGKVPVLQPAIEKRDYEVDHFQDSYVFLNAAERCITYGIPGGQFPGINASMRILQSPGEVALVVEMNGARVIPVDGSSHLPQNIRMWNGDSRGHWEGNTLVIDITNYNDKGTVTHAPNRLQGIKQSEKLHITERFTIVDANTINYEATVDDPGTYARPWKVAWSLLRDDGSYRVFEYVCHEGNERFMNIVLGGGRLKDKGPGAEAAVASPTRKAAEEAARAPAK